MLFIAKKGINVVGFDLSKRMIQIAKKKINNNNIQNIASVKVANASNYRDNCKYDIIISMFATMGYVSIFEDFLSAVKTARAHLEKNGLFIFDCWFGPAVMNILPETRINEFEIEKTKAIRIVEPICIDSNQELVKTKNTIIQMKDDHIINHVVEFHTIRFFFIKELELIFNNCGFEFVFSCPFLQPSKDVTLKDWNISVVAKAI